MTKENKEALAAVAEKIKEGKLAVTSAYYNIHTGKVVID